MKISILEMGKFAPWEQEERNMTQQLQICMIEIHNNYLLELLAVCAGNVKDFVWDSHVQINFELIIYSGRWVLYNISHYLLKTLAIRAKGCGFLSGFACVLLAVN
jgi:hypothetical protein